MFHREIDVVGAENVQIDRAVRNRGNDEIVQKRQNRGRTSAGEDSKRANEAVRSRHPGSRKKKCVNAEEV